MQLSSTADISPPTVSIFEDGSAVAGETFTLLCRVVLPDGLTTRPMVEWLSPEGNTLMSEGELTVGDQQVIGNPSRLTTYMAQFSPVMTSHGGTYTCQATVLSPQGTLQESSATTYNVSIQGDWPLISKPTHC